MERWSRSAAAFLIVAGLAVGCYLNALGGPFLYDDQRDIATNPLLREPGRLDEVFTTSFLHEGKTRALYRPITGLTYWIDHRLFGPNPFGFHLANIFWHTAASLAVLVLIRSLWPAEPLMALMGAALFAAHPVHTEAVSWISGRSEVLATFWGILAFWAHRRADGEASTAPLWRIAALAAWLVALGAKEMAATIPLLLVMTDGLLGRPLGWWRPGRLAARYGPYLGVAAAYGAVRWSVLDQLGPVGAHQYFHGASMSIRGPTMLKVAAGYVERLVLPVNLNASWTVPHARGLTDGAGPLLALALLVALLGLAWAARRSATPVAWGILWTGLALLPVSNLLPIGELAGERFLYAPSVGACVAIAWVMTRGGKPSTEASSTAPAPLVWVLGCAVVILFAINTVDRNRDWSDDLALWEKTARQSPRSVNARMNVGKALFQRGSVEDAARHFEAALELSPTHVDALNNLGAAYGQLGRIDEANRAFHHATIIRPDHPQAWYNLGFLRYRQRDFSGAEEALRRARGLDAQNPKVPYLLGLVAYRRGDLEEAEARWRETLEIDPSFTKASRNLTALLEARERGGGQGRRR
ncbi:MAG: tetratricopeptide repeat protein [bacterium]|nr:tetratricopeptide repeat protein [bacterium]